MAELTIIVPTFNERDNIQSLVDALDKALKGIAWEVLFVDDDSPDKTADTVRLISAQRSDVKVLQRIGRRGLSSACIEGMLACDSPTMAVIDADLQHDESILPGMLELLREQDLDLVVASRYMTGGSARQGLGRGRHLASRISGWLSSLFTGSEVTDPMSGFFMLRRSLFEPVADKLSGQGFKILVDILLSVEGDFRLGEVPYEMKARQSGQSKASILVALEFVLVLLHKRLQGLLPIRFMLFLLVGLSGVVVHLLVLTLLMKLTTASFLLSQTLSTWVAMTSNFFLNNLLTYRDQRLAGKRIIQGLLSFYVACSLGAVLNIAVADLLFVNGVAWPIAGISGAAIAAVWNYLLTSFITWGRK